MVYKNICTKKTFKTRDGEEKVKWLNVGTLKETDDGKTFIELTIFPNTPFYVFDQRKKESPAESSNEAWLDEGQS